MSLTVRSYTYGRWQHFEVAEHHIVTFNTVREVYRVLDFEND